MANQVCHPVTSRPLVFLQKQAVLSPCNFTTTHLTAFILHVCLLLTSRPMKWMTLSQCPISAIPHVAQDLYREVSTPTTWCDTPWHLASQRHICAITPFFKVSRDIFRLPMKLARKSLGILSLQVPLGTKLLHTIICLFWGIVFGSYCRKLYSVKMSGGISLM